MLSLFENDKIKLPPELLSDWNHWSSNFGVVPGEASHRPSQYRASEKEREREWLISMSQFHLPGRLTISPLNLVPRRHLCSIIVVPKHLPICSLFSLDSLKCGKDMNPNYW